MAFRVMSNAFSNGAFLPRRYTRDGANESPLIFWDELPPGTQSLALIMFDRSTEPTSNHYHWLAYDISAREPLLAAALPKMPVLDDGIKQGLNDFRELGYTGPTTLPGICHDYVFRLYALAATPGALAGGISHALLFSAIERFGVLGVADTHVAYATPLGAAA